VEGVAQIFAWGVKAFQKKFQGVPYFGFYWIISYMFFENLPGGASVSPPLCASMVNFFYPARRMFFGCFF